MTFAWILGLFTKKISKVQGPKQEKKNKTQRKENILA